MDDYDPVPFLADEEEIIDVTLLGITDPHAFRSPNATSPPKAPLGTRWVRAPDLKLRCVVLCEPGLILFLLRMCSGDGVQFIKRDGGDSHDFLSFCLFSMWHPVRNQLGGISYPFVLSVVPKLTDLSSRIIGLFWIPLRLFVRHISSRLYGCI